MAPTTFDGAFDGTFDGKPELKALPDIRHDSCEAVEYTTKMIEEGRRQLAYIYARTKGGTAFEHEIGECLALVRKAEKRLLEAYTELAQQELPPD